LKAYLLHKDGRRVERVFEGAQRIHVPKAHEDGTYTETIFEADPDIVDGCVVYREAETKDVTESMRRAEQENRERTWKYLRKGWGVE
jgi:hypothetical protein